MAMTTHSETMDNAQEFTVFDPDRKEYHGDLNASYNIGARYFVREISMSMPATDWQELSAKVPGALKRNTCTLPTLINLNAVLVS